MASNDDGDPLTSWTASFATSLPTAAATSDSPVAPPISTLRQGSRSRPPSLTADVGVDSDLSFTKPLQTATHPSREIDPPGFPHNDDDAGGTSGMFFSGRAASRSLPLQVRFLLRDRVR